MTINFKKTISSFNGTMLRPGASKKISAKVSKYKTKAKHKVFGKPAPKYKIVKRISGWKKVNVKRKGKWVQEKRPIFKKVKVAIKSKPTPRRTGRGFVGY